NGDPALGLEGGAVQPPQGGDQIVHVAVAAAEYEGGHLLAELDPQTPPPKADDRQLVAVAVGGEVAGQTATEPGLQVCQLQAELPGGLSRGNHQGITPVPELVEQAKQPALPGFVADNVFEAL